MAQRTINEIYQSIIVEKNNMPTLKDKLKNEDGTTQLSDEQGLLDRLKTDSIVAIWKLWAYMTAVVIWFHESLWYVFQDNINSIIDNGYVGTLKWLIQKAKEFQYGDEIVLEEPNYTPHYDVVDTNKQIIASANALEGGTEVFLKVRRKDTDILTTDEMSAFQNYINKIKFAGQRINIINSQPDELRLYMNVYYTNDIISMDNLKTQVEDAINNYIINIEFDSRINVSKLIDEIQKINGVDGVLFDTNNSAGKPYTSQVWTPIQNYYNSYAGWNIISLDYPLSDTITYTKA